ncbi:hypothetical protein KJ807_01630 [Patescibacteria group bacterium]|nr:hypothetical protein [Patescibacteria group bacterium]MBU1623400.1 hypothetical protein [Nanoarchaeota archaeon]
MKLEENGRKALWWEVKRLLAKANYKVHTDAVKERLIPAAISKKQADERGIHQTGFIAKRQTAKT